MPRKIKSEVKIVPELSANYDSEDAGLLSHSDPSPEPDISAYRPDREGIRKVMGDLEADIMEHIWEINRAGQPGITVREVYEAFRLRRVIAYTTVMSTMARLARKHLLEVQKVDTAYLYTPNLSKEDFIDSFVSRILENLLVNFSQPVESHLERLGTEADKAKINILKQKIDQMRDK